jgi:hypothetical protein
MTDDINISFINDNLELVKIKNEIKFKKFDDQAIFYNNIEINIQIDLKSNSSSK